MKKIAIFAAGVVVAATPVVLRAETPLERGTYLMNSIVACGNCHTPQTPEGPAPGKELTGQVVEDIPAYTAVAPNITPAGRVGGWSDAELKRAIREGVRPDGSVIGPPMPIGLYRGMADSDLDAIVAYLRQVPAVESELPRSVYNIPLPPSYGPPVGSVTAPDRDDDPVAYGAYLAGPLGHCVECHSTPGANGAPDTVNALGAGGMEFHGPWGVSVAANITPGGPVADWTDAELEHVIRTGERPDGTHLKPPMPVGYYANIAPEDMAAIIAYLRSLPPK